MFLSLKSRPTKQNLRLLTTSHCQISGQNISLRVSGFSNMEQAFPDQDHPSVRGDHDARSPHTHKHTWPPHVHTHEQRNEKSITAHFIKLRSSLKLHIQQHQPDQNIKPFGLAKALFGPRNYIDSLYLSLLLIFYT